LTVSAVDLSLLPRGIAISHDHPKWIVTALVKDPENSKPLGTVVIAFQRPFPEGPGWRPAVHTALVLLIVAVITRPLARRISRPLEALTDAAQRLGSGDFKTRIPVHEGSSRRWLGRNHPADEMQTVTASFNDMAQRIETLIASHKDLLANVSHELRSPLARIRVALELMPRSAAVEKRLQGIETDLTELENLIDQVLTASRLESTSLKLQLSELDCRELFARIIEQAARDPVTAGHEIRALVGPGVVLIADEELKKRALWNLVENAAKYGAPPITLEAASVDNAVELSVTDRGPGVPESARERVFEAFYRQDAARTPSAGDAQRPGVGLGLALARRIVEAHGGTIRITSASPRPDESVGCRVRIVMPLSKTV
jgi:signal transduction histidine kinase